MMGDAPKRSVGRPRKSVEDKAIQTKIWMLPATREAVKAAAAKVGTNPSRWMVGAVEQELKKASIL